MGSWGHSIQIKASPDRKRTTQKTFERLLGTVVTSFSSFIPLGISRQYYQRVGEMNDIVTWSCDRSTYKETQTVTITAEVYTHPKYDLFDHWLALFIARLTNGKDIYSARAGMAEKQFDIVPTTLDYLALLQATDPYNQFVVLERGFYLLQKQGPHILPLQVSKGQPDHHFQPADAPYDASIPLDFFKSAEQARINAHLDSDYCLCPLCQSERSRFGII